MTWRANKMFVMVRGNGESPAVKAALSAAIQQEIAEISEISVSADCIVVIWQQTPEDQPDNRVVISVQGLADGIRKKAERCLRAIACKYLGKCEVEVRPLPSMHHISSVLSELVAA